MTPKYLSVLAVALSLGAAVISFGTSEAQAKCKFGCGLAIGLGAGILGSAIVDSNRSRHYDEGYSRPVRTRPRSRWVGSQEWLDYCYSKYRSFDARSGTYVGYDGYRHNCR